MSTEYPDPDEAVAAHCGDPLAEQRAMARSAAVVDRSHRELPEGTGSEALILDAQGRVLHHMVVSHVGDTVYLDTDQADLAELLAYLQKMVFWAKVQPRDATAELAVLSLVGPETAAVLEKAGLPVPEGDYASVALPEGGLVRRMPWPGPSAADLLVPRASLGATVDRLVAAGARPAGTMAFEALRVESRRPRAHLDTDERTIPHEVDWIPSAVHLTKGCYRGQETVARVANLGRPPRRLVLLHLDAGDEELPVTGDPVLREGRTVGRVGSVTQHHELGPVALALLKRSVPADAELVAGTDERSSPATIDPGSYVADETAPPPGRAAQLRVR
jgi:folate-binding protein YgfZ